MVTQPPMNNCQGKGLFYCLKHTRQPGAALPSVGTGQAQTNKEMSGDHKKIPGKQLRQRREYEMTCIVLAK